MPRAGTIGTRVRKNAKDLTADEWRRFINALKAIKGRSRPGGVISIYDEFSALHMGAVELHRRWRSKPEGKPEPADPAHDNPGFLPWHRQLLLEFESALQAVDPTVTLPYWDWTDREFNQKLFSPAYMGGNGGHDGKGGALVDGPFTLDQGWLVNPVLHRPGWFTNDPKTGYPTEDPRLSLGRSIVRYLGDFGDLATSADVIEFTKRKAMFGPEKLILRSDMCFPQPKVPPLKGLPRGTLYKGDLPYSDAAEVQGTERTDLTDKAFREDVQGFRWGIEASPHMHNQTHDWFGYHTAILQDGLINGSSTMPNVACSTADPMFFMHHCNIDRLWAEWQDSGHYGSIFYPKRGDQLMKYKNIQDAFKGQPIGPYEYPQGHNLDDRMWPWDDNETETQKPLQSMIPQYSYTLTARDLLDYRSLGYSYDTSTELAVNSVAPVVVYLPSVEDKVTRQVFPLSIQRPASYLISAWNKGLDLALLKIAVYKKYEETFELDFVNQGFKATPLTPAEGPHFVQPDDRKQPVNAVYPLERGTYFVVVEAILPKNREPEPGAARSPALDSYYEIAVATSPQEWKMPDVSIAPGVITKPQVPAESAVYLALHSYAPVQLEDGVTQWRRTHIKGTHELFGINVVYTEQESQRATINFEGMDALVQLYGPFSLDNDTLPQFDSTGEPIGNKEVSKTVLRSNFQIASSEGCCNRMGSGISSVVSPGRYILSVFHCSIGPNEGNFYKVTYRLGYGTAEELVLGTMTSYPPSGRSVDLLYCVMTDRVKERETNKPPRLITNNRDIYTVRVFTDDMVTQEEVNVGVYTYSKDAFEDKADKQLVSYNYGYWGRGLVTFEPLENQVLFIRITILNGSKYTKIKTIIQKGM